MKTQSTAWKSETSTPLPPTLTAHVFLRCHYTLALDVSHEELKCPIWILRILSSLLKFPFPPVSTSVVSKWTKTCQLVVLSCVCHFWRTAVFSTNSQCDNSHRNRQLSCFVSFFLSLDSNWTQHVWPCGFFHSHKQTSCWLTTTCLSDLIHKHINSITHTSWQQILDSSNIFRHDKHRNQPESEGQFPFAFLIGTKIKYSQARIY